MTCLLPNLFSPAVFRNSCTLINKRSMHYHPSYHLCTSLSLTARPGRFFSDYKATKQSLGKGCEDLGNTQWNPTVRSPCRICSSLSTVMCSPWYMSILSVFPCISFLIKVSVIQSFLVSLLKKGLL